MLAPQTLRKVIFAGPVHGHVLSWTLASVWVARMSGASIEKGLGVGVIRNRIRPTASQAMKSF